MTPRNDQDHALLVAAYDRQRAKRPRPPESDLALCLLTFEGHRCTYSRGHLSAHEWQVKADERQQLEDAIERARERRGDHSGPEYRYVTGAE